MMLPPLSFNRESTRDIDAYEYEYALAGKPPPPPAERVSPLASKAVSHSHNLHLKKIISELVGESSNMESSMINASKYYYLISYLIFYPSILLNTFIGCFVLTFTCSSFRSSQISACLATDDMDCVQNYVGNMNANSRADHAWQYLLASLAFVNAMLIGLQKTLRPAENGEMFQVVARRWGAFLRQLVAYKQTTPTSSYSQRKVRLYITQFAMLMENSPLLPQHFLRTKRNRKSIDGPHAPGAAEEGNRASDERGYVRQNESTQRLSSFLVHMSPVHKHARRAKSQV